MILYATLVQPLSARDQTISLSAGPLAWDTEILIPGDAPTSQQERMSVCGVLSKTQAKVVRGDHGTVARSYPVDTIVGLLVEGPMHEVLVAPVIEAEPETIRPPRRATLDIAGTTKRGACPTCGRDD